MSTLALGDALAHLDWLAVVVATLAYYLLGAVWFSPLLGRAWDRSIGHDRATGGRFGTAYYVVPLVSALVVTVALAVVLTVLAPPTAGEAVVVGLAAGCAVAAVSVNNALTPHTPHPFLLGAVTGGYHVVGIALVAAILGAFLAG